MICYIFKLDNYFDETSKYYHFFDGLFCHKRLMKVKVLSELNISDSSYRVERTRSIVKNKNISILLKYFNYNEILKEQKIKYEALFAKIYYCCYFKSQNSFSYYLEQLNDLLNERNILYPVAVLFKVFLYANMEMKIKECKELLQEELNFLLSFYNTSYFADDLHFLYLSMIYFFNWSPDKNEEILRQIKDYSYKISKLSWLCLNIRASREYLLLHPKEAIAHYVQLAEEYKENHNMIRYFQTINNLALMYNMVEEYEYSLKYTSKVIEYLFSSTEYEKWITFILTHYFYSLLMLKRYSQIIEFVNIIIFDKKYLSDISATAYLIALKESNHEFAYKEIDSITNDFKFYNIVKEYYKSFSEPTLKEIGNQPYMVGIHKFLTSKNTI